MQFPYEIHPDSIESESVDATLARADVEWEVEDEDFELDGSEWADVDEETDADVFYE